MRNKTENKYIARMKKRRRNKRIFICLLLLVLGCLLIVFKTDIFKIKHINIECSKIAVKEEIEEKLDNFKGSNILTIKFDEVKSKLNDVAYVEGVKLSKSLPNKINVLVEESEISYYIYYKKEYYILTKELKIVDKTTDRKKLAGLGLMEIKGIKPISKKIGDKIVEDNGRISKLLSEIEKVKKANTSGKKLEWINLKNMVAIELSIDNVIIKLGDDEAPIYKLDQALKVLMDKKINIKNGYIDVTVPSRPVIKKGK